jgi:threonine dehydratase
MSTTPGPTGGHPITPGDVRQAADRMRGHLVETPLVHSRTLSAITGADLYLKLENLQYTASFKDRGSLNRLLQLDAEERTRGVLAVSAGNHAQGVAHHAGRLGIPATIVMPRFTPNVKVANTRALGAEVVLEGDDFPSAARHAQRLREDGGLVFVAPYDDPAVIAGQGTVALEMLAAEPELDVLVVPVGGGGLIAGMAVAARDLRPGIEVVGVQSARWPGTHLMKHTGDTDGVEGGQTIADGIAVSKPGELTAPIIRDLVDEVRLVDEPGIEAAIAMLIEIEKTVAEGAGAIALAAVRAEPERFAGRRVGLVVSGGNIDTRLLANVLQRELIRSRRLSRLSVDLRDVPGELAAVSSILGHAGANIVEVSHQRMWSDVIATAAVLDLAIETRDADHAHDVAERLRAAGYRVRPET